MAAAFKFGEVLWVHFVNLQTKKAALQRVRILMTDAVGPRGVVHNETALARAIEEAVAQMGHDDVDGFHLVPWGGDPTGAPVRCARCGRMT